MSAVRRGPRRALYALGCLVWLFILSLPLLGFMLAMRGQFQWQRGEFVEDRIWLISEPDQGGLGYSSSRIASNEEPVDGPICVRTRVIFLLWQGSAEPVGYCECYTAGLHEPAGECP